MVFADGERDKRQGHGHDERRRGDCLFEGSALLHFFAVFFVLAGFWGFASVCFTSTFGAVAGASGTHTPILSFLLITHIVGTELVSDYGRSSTGSPLDGSLACTVTHPVMSLLAVWMAVRFAEVAL